MVSRSDAHITNKVASTVLCSAVKHTGSGRARKKCKNTRQYFLNLFLFFFYVFFCFVCFLSNSRPCCPSPRCQFHAGRLSLNPGTIGTLNKRKLIPIWRLSLVFTSYESTNASNREDPSENEIPCKHKHKAKSSEPSKLFRREVIQVESGSNNFNSQLCYA